MARAAPLLLVAGAALLAVAAGAQEPGPRPLFPALPPPVVVPEPVEEPPPETLATPPVGVAPLPPPGLGARGLPRAEIALRGPLWPAEAPPGLAARIARLPAHVDDPVLRRLQRDLLLAPGPGSGAGVDVLRARVERLLAMGEAAAAAELLATVPDTPAGAELDPLRVEALLAADEIEPACALVDQVPLALRPEATLVCAALLGDRARVDLGLALLRERGTPADPLLVSLLQALGGGERVQLREPPPADPLLLPLLRRAPLQPQPRAVTEAPPAVRQAIAQNPAVPAGLAPPAAEPTPLPTYPGLGGQPVRDWAQALDTVPEARRPRWLAAMDGLGAEPPLADVPPEARLLEGGRADLAAWRDLEAALTAEARGPVLLATLLLLDGRPGEVSPLALRAAVRALRGLELEPEARAVAALGIAGRPR